jgi:hypothetical protein
MKKVKMGLYGLNIQKFIAKSRNVLTAMEGNANFPNPSVPIQTVVAEVQELERLQLEIMAGHIHMVSIRDYQANKVRNMMNVICDYVNSVAQGDESMLQSSGFEFRKTPTPHAIPEKIERISAINLVHRGSVKVRWSGSKGRLGYILEYTYTADNADSWVNVTQNCTKTQYILDGLIPGKNVYFRVSAYNGAGQSLWSDVARIMVD